MRRKLSVLLTAALLLSVLPACQSNPQEPGDDSDSSSVSSSRPSRLPKFLFGASSDTSEPLPEEEPQLTWDPDYTLDLDYPAVAKGRLELPVHGATGYASIELPLWEEVPKPEPEPEPEPEPPAQPALQPQPQPQPSEPQPSVEPEPQPVDTSEDELSGDPPASGDASSQESVPPVEGDISAQPPEEEVQPEPPADPSLGYLPVEPQPTEPEPSQPVEPTPAPEPEPEPEPEKDPYEGALAVLKPGTAFTILSEEEKYGELWWRVQSSQGTGWIQCRYCLINLPDVIPSMVYDATNAYDSKFVSLGKIIPNVTGKAFYTGKTENPRLGRKEFMMPVLYSMAPHICQAQQAALAQGNTLILYEGYRPYDTQKNVVNGLRALMNTDSDVKEAITSAPWEISWFIAVGVSNHQQGYAMDVSLARVNDAEIQTIGGHKVVHVLEYEEYTMPTPIHELSRNAATFTGPVAIFSTTAWKNAKLSEAMASNDPALALQRYCTGASLTPLASEWWHFNDLAAYNSIRSKPSSGNYEITVCRSTAP